MQGPQTPRAGPPAPCSLPLRSPAGRRPRPLAGRALPAREIQGRQGAGLFTRFICFSGKVENTGPVTHRKQRGSKGTSAEASSSRTQPLKEGRGQRRCLGPPRRGPLPPPPGAALRRGRGGARAWAPGEGPRGTPVDPQPTRKRSECGHGCASGDERVYSPGDGCANPDGAAPRREPLTLAPFQGDGGRWGSPAADRGRSLPRPRPLHCPEGATPSSAVWGTVGGTQGPGPHRREKGPGPPPPRVPKLAPGGRRAQWRWQLRARRGSRGPALCGGGSLTLACQHPGNSAGLTAPPEWGMAPGLPLPGAIVAGRTQRAQREGTSGWSLTGSPQQGSASPTCPGSGRQCFDWGTVSPGAERRWSRPPGPLSSPVPLWRDVPSGTSLEVAGRHRQEAQRVAGPAGRGPWAGARLRSCRHVGLGSSAQAGRGCPCLSPTGRGRTALWLGVCRGRDGWGTPVPLPSERKLRRRT